MTLSMVPPNLPFTTARRWLPTVGGPSVNSSPLMAFAAHFGDRVRIGQDREHVLHGAADRDADVRVCHLRSSLLDRTATGQMRDCGVPCGDVQT